MTKPRRAVATSSARIHPGQYVRENILVPKKLTVLAAAKLVGVSRPAFSNFINGNVGTTPEMASRIEIAFGVPAQELLDIQAAFEVEQSTLKEVALSATPYVVPFLGIKARDIESWATGTIAARTRLAVLLRILVHSTGTNLEKVDFPGNDDAERPGWDGQVQTEATTPWIPSGNSGWEFGVNQEAKRKAEGDYAQRVSNTAADERKQITFVFVTPQKWSQKNSWAAEKRAQSQWKDVRAYDSSDLEQWIEQSIPAQTWFANETGSPSEGVTTLEKCWSRWAGVTNPQLSGELFASSVESTKDKVLQYLSQPPADSLLITADSTEEALAYLAQLFNGLGGDDFLPYRDRALVFSNAATFSKLAQGNQTFIAIATHGDVAKEIAAATPKTHSIAIYPHNAANVTPAITLEPLSSSAFRTALEKMGCSFATVNQYDRESGRSLTVLRRRLATDPSVKNPEWAAKQEIASQLVPFMFIGAWGSANSFDKELLAKQGNRPYGELERTCQHLTTLGDAPLWSIGAYRGVVSKIDLLFAISPTVTEEDLNLYFDVAKQVLGEDDPSLDLPQDKRWAASIYGKTRRYSAALREGISETLVLLAVHGNQLFQGRLGVNCEQRVSLLIEELLTPFDARKLEANDRDLPGYAEAAPVKFLDILEEDLRKPQPEVFSLLRPADSTGFGGCPRTGLLWALELLAWHQDQLLRVVLILAKLSEIEISDNWINKPFHSLEAIFRAWMPQTSLDHDGRIKVLEQLTKKFPDVAWRLCISQIPVGPNIGDYSYRPKWRTDAYGFGEPLRARAPINAFVQAVINILLAWPHGYSKEKLCGLISHIPHLSGQDQGKVWEIVHQWASTEQSDSDKSIVREAIRRAALSRRGQRHVKGTDLTELSNAATTAYSALEPASLIFKHEWLFRKHWIEESISEQDEDIDYTKREERIQKLRLEALSEIYSDQGLPGIFELVPLGEAPYVIGWLLGKFIVPAQDLLATVLAALDVNNQAMGSLVQGVLHSQSDDRRTELLTTAVERLSGVSRTELLLLAPFRKATWELVDALDDPSQKAYWKSVSPDWIPGEPDESREAVERLIIAGRPKAAFACAHFQLATLGPELIFKLMSEILAGTQERQEEYLLDPYYIQEAFRIMDESPMLTLEQKAGLELAYVDALTQAWGNDGQGIPNLERYVEANPNLFVQAITWAYRRKSDGEDPADVRVDPQYREGLAKRGHALLDALSKLPGHDANGILQADLLAHWITTVRNACHELDRLDVADICIGKLLSKAPTGTDGVWPCEPVREVLEDINSDQLLSGMHTGLYNSRGVTWRGEGGDQERALAEKYRNWANALRFSYPVITRYLMQMVQTYENEAEREDIEAGIKRRLT